MLCLQLATASYTLSLIPSTSLSKVRDFWCVCVCVCVILLSVSVLNEGRERKRDDEANHGVILCAC